MDKINFENLPSTSTPVNADNLNQVQTNVENEFGNYYKLGVGSPITSGTDLNDMTTPGTYYPLTTETTYSLVNCPVSGSGFKLIVENTTGINRVVQTIKVNNTAQSTSYVRTRTDVWGDWKRICHQVYARYGNTHSITLEYGRNYLVLASRRDSSNVTKQFIYIVSLPHDSEHTGMVTPIGQNTFSSISLSGNILNISHDYTSVDVISST